MLILLLLQSILLAGLFGLVMYWRVEAAGRARAQQDLDTVRAQAADRLQMVVMQLQNDLTELRERDRQAEPISSVVVEAAPALTLAKRSKALKMIRRGEATEAVSAALGIPKNQVRLLVKVQEMLEPRETVEVPTGRRRQAN
jgi:hypothetical protein